MQWGVHFLQRKLSERKHKDLSVCVCLVNRKQTRKVPWDGQLRVERSALITEGFSEHHAKKCGFHSLAKLLRSGITRTGLYFGKQGLKQYVG